MGLLTRLSKGCEEYKISLYANDSAIFIKLTKQDFNTIKYILEIFVEASGLNINMAKIEFFPIQCQNVHLSFLTHNDLVISSFPCKYLGMPLHHRKPSRTMM
jgi:hypothetical protein